MSLLEAMSYGNCCLTSDIPECAEVVEGHAATFQHGSVESCGKNFRNCSKTVILYNVTRQMLQITSSANIAGMTSPIRH